MQLVLKDMGIYILVCSWLYFCIKVECNSL